MGVRCGLGEWVLGCATGEGVSLGRGGGGGAGGGGRVGGGGPGGSRGGYGEAVRRWSAHPRPPPPPPPRPEGALGRSVARRVERVLR